MPLEEFLNRGRETKMTGYIEKTFKGTEEEYIRAKKESATLYVSNLSFGHREEYLWRLFGLFGTVRRIIQGIHRNHRTPCGFAFVEYHRREDADAAQLFCRNMQYCERMLRVEKDAGFVEGRQYGRGMFGGAMRNDNAMKRRIAYGAPRHVQ